MRLIVMFDLPTVSKTDQQKYNKFRTFLLQNGYYMLQFSIYVKLCTNYDDLRKHIKRLRFHIPDKGNVRCLTVTEKQYEEMEIFVGMKSYQEEYTNLNPIIEL